MFPAPRNSPSEETVFQFASSYVFYGLSVVNDILLHPQRQYDGDLLWNVTLHDASQSKYCEGCFCFLEDRLGYQLFHD